jgi:AraC-like DNA-binding protein
MPPPTADHDRSAAVPDRDPTPGLTALLDSALSGLRLRGAVFLRGEYSEAWAYRSMDATTTAAVLQPGAPRVALFHVVAAGRCWIALEDGERHWASAGDVIVLPYGDQHSMGGSADAELASMATMFEPPPWSRMPLIRHGAGGDRTDVVCGYLHSDDPLFDPALRALPPLFVVTPPEGRARHWVQASIQYALERTATAATGGLTGPTELPELLLREVLRLHLSSAPGSSARWLAALRDPVVSPALAAIHAAPERKWTVAELGREAGVSVSLLDERFREVLGLAPIRYLTGWRMHVAEELLTSTHLNIGGVARRAGYDSEEAFSRAFKRIHGRSPGAWRTDR